MRLPLVLALSTAPLLTAAVPAKPTYYKDVLPILQARCQECHRAGEIGPAKFTSYKETRPWARAIREAVLTRRMPPWFADPAHGTFANDRSLARRDIETLVAWADTGAAEGNPVDAPPAREYLQGWNIPQPDVVIQLPKPFRVPAQGTVEYQYIVIPTGFTEDKWVQMAEVRPTARQVVHHMIAYVRTPESKWLRGEAEPGVPFVPPKTTPDGRKRNDTGGGGSEFLCAYVPGATADVFRPGQAKLIKAGSDLVFQMHYTANGKEMEDQTAVGLVFAKEPPKERLLTVAIVNDQFVIPPGAPNHAVDAKRTFPNGGTILHLFPHMHVRGKAFEYRLAQPGAAAETLLKVPRYDFNWQLIYKLEKPIALQPGAVLEATGWFDNSPNNPHNPDPKAEVRWGEQSWEEMMIGFVDVAIDARQDPRTFFRAREKKTD